MRILIIITFASTFLTTCAQQSPDPFKGKCQNEPKAFFYYTGRQLGKGEYNGKFKNCLLDSTWTWYYSNGVKDQERYFVDGKQQGIGKKWFTTGQLMIQSEYQNDKLNGETIEWFSSGQIISKKIFVNDTIIKKTEWYETGSVMKQMNYKNGIRHGEHKKWDKEGNIIFRTFYLSGEADSIWTFYHSNGIVKYTGKYDNGKEVGIWTEYDDKGNLLKEEFFQNGVLIEEKQRLIQDNKG